MSGAGTNYNEMGIEEVTKNQGTYNIRNKKLLLILIRFIYYPAPHYVHRLPCTLQLHSQSVWHRTVSHSLNYINNELYSTLYVHVCV